MNLVKPIAELLKARKLFGKDLAENLRTKSFDVYAERLDEPSGGYIIYCEDADQNPVAAAIIEITEAEFLKLERWILRIFRQSAAAVARRLRAAA